MTTLVSRRALLFAVMMAPFFPGRALVAQEPPKELILPGERITAGGHSGFVFLPPEGKRSAPQPWVLYAPTLPGLPDLHEKWMHEQFLAAGVAVAGLDIGEAFGSPKGQEGLSALYQELTTKRKFAARPVLLGRSRGGLWVTSWAAANPDKVAGIAGIYPVFDLESYPGLDRAAPAYGMSADELKRKLGELNPINRVGILAKAKIPAYIIHGDVDKVVPLEKNSAVFADHYREAGAKDLVTVNVIAGQGHNYWEGFFRCKPLVEFVIKQAKRGE